MRNKQELARDAALLQDVYLDAAPRVSQVVEQILADKANNATEAALRAGVTTEEIQRHSRRA